VRLRLTIGTLALLTACARPPAAGPPGTATVWGHVRLVPRADVTPGHADATPYAERRLRDVTYVDYGRPGFAVVYLDGQPAPGGTARLAIEASLLAPHLVPAHAAVGVGGTAVVRNADFAAHTITCPEAKLLRRLAPGEEVAIAVGSPGPWTIFLLDARGDEAIVFAAPGPYAVVGEDGRWELHGVDPGRSTVHAWHPRFPPAERTIDVVAGAVQEVDLALGVGNLALHEPSR